jgi:hypothetical protein
MEIRFVLFRSSHSPWDVIMQRAADFANMLRPEQLVSISHSCDKLDSVVAVWFWADIKSPESEKVIWC